MSQQSSTNFVSYTSRYWQNRPTHKILQRGGIIYSYYSIKMSNDNAGFVIRKRYRYWLDVELNRDLGLERITGIFESDTQVAQR